MRLTDRVKLDEAVALRPERFGALAYSYNDRRLLFIDRALLPFVESGGVRTVGEIADEDSLGGTQLERILLVLEALKRKGILRAG
ncbi:MAG: mycofactocin biosynthesis chaperone MftB [Candidatus Dormibacteraeota bacterium]|nr:mycofactocin biosynthesis chaperone MftB [Candidatus Dormibacteraeota bacterium]